MTKPRPLALFAAGALTAATATLAGCDKTIEAPSDRGVCWHMAVTAQGKARFNALARNQSDLEHCAAQLDEMRLRFMGLGSTQNTVVGAFQGQFLFAGPQGVYTAPSLDGYRYLLMVHSGDGRLVTPSSMPTQ
jgi:hypothetical protein